MCNATAEITMSVIGPGRDSWIGTSLPCRTGCSNCMLSGGIIMARSTIQGTLLGFNCVPPYLKPLLLGMIQRINEEHGFVIYGKGCACPVARACNQHIVNESDLVVEQTALRAIATGNSFSFEAQICPSACLFRRLVVEEYSDIDTSAMSAAQSVDEIGVGECEHSNKNAV